MSRLVDIEPYIEELEKNIENIRMHSNEAACYVEDIIEELKKLPTVTEQEKPENIKKMMELLEELYDRTDRIKKEAYQDKDWEKFDLHTNRNEGIYSAISIIKQAELVERCNNGWIPCSDRLPNICEEVIGYSIDGHIVLTILVETPIKGKYWLISDDIDVRLDDIVAWQPLPAPYKEDKDVHKEL